MALLEFWVYKSAPVKVLSGEKRLSDLGFQSCQQEGLSKFRDDKRKPDREKVASSEEENKRKTCRGERILRCRTLGDLTRRGTTMEPYLTRRGIKSVNRFDQRGKRCFFFLISKILYENYHGESPILNAQAKRCRDLVDLMLTLPLPGYVRWQWLPVTGYHNLTSNSGTQHSFLMFFVGTPTSPNIIWKQLPVFRWICRRLTLLPGRRNVQLFQPWAHWDFSTSWGGQKELGIETDVGKSWKSRCSGRTSGRDIYKSLGET